MTKLERQVNALMRLCTAEDNDSYEAAKKEVRALMGSYRGFNYDVATIDEAAAKPTDMETEVRNLLLELGFPDHLVGHPYLVQAIMLVAKDRKQLDNMSRPYGLYYKVAESFETTSSKVERGIRHCVETAWKRCDLDVLYRYFGNIVDPNKDKPTNTEFIARAANVIRMRMKQ